MLSENNKAGDRKQKRQLLIFRGKRSHDGLMLFNAPTLEERHNLSARSFVINFSLSLFCFSVFYMPAPPLLSSSPSWRTLSEPRMYRNRSEPRLASVFIFCDVLPTACSRCPQRGPIGSAASPPTTRDSSRRTPTPSPSPRHPCHLISPARYETLCCHQGKMG